MNILIWSQCSCTCIPYWVHYHLLTNRCAYSIKNL